MAAGRRGGRGRASPQPETFDEVLAEHAGRVPLLRRGGGEGAANVLEDVLADIRAHAPEFLTWHDLKGAMLLSGKPAGYFRSRFGAWEARRLARRKGRGQMEFLECVIPKQGQVEALVRDAIATADADAA